jgi:polysaccharide export outer membrane protein
MSLTGLPMLVLRFAPILFLLTSACGCSVLPGTGPAGSSLVVADDDVSAGGYAIVDINKEIVAALKLRPDPSLTSLSQYQPASAPVIGIGDTIRVTLWEAAPGNLFTTVASNNQSSIGSAGGTAIPDQVVPRTGTINVPFAGDIKVVGKSTRDVEKAIVAQLRGKAVDPQALVNVVRSEDNSVTVAGDAVVGGQFQLSPNNERVLEAIAVTGGIKTPVHDTFVSLTRGNRVITIPYLTLASNPSENVRLSPRDVLLLYAHRRTYMVFGAAPLNAEIPFDAPTVSLAQALARAGGLNDNKADASGVFLFRYEPSEFIARLFPDGPPALNARVPVIYRLNLRDPTGLFLAQSFSMREGDMIYIANAPGADLVKFLGIIGTVVSPAVSGATLYNVAK